jgi:hypothetical protein
VVSVIGLPSGLPCALPGGKKARALNYHDLEKARGLFSRAKPGGSGGFQAARNTGPVIRIAKTRVMAALLADRAAGIKHFLPRPYIVKSKR